MAGREAALLLSANSQVQEGRDVENIPTTEKQGRIVIFAYTCFITETIKKLVPAIYDL